MVYARKYCLDFYQQYFDFAFDTSTNTWHIYKKELNNLQEINDQEDLFHDLVNLKDSWEFYQYIYNITYQLLELKINKYKYNINLVYYSLFFIGFGGYFLILIGFY